MLIESETILLCKKYHQSFTFDRHLVTTESSAIQTFKQNRKVVVVEV